MQGKIRDELNVTKQGYGESDENFAKRMIKERSEFLKDYLKSTPCECMVLGLSGGVDSFVASMLIKKAGIELVSISLPYGEQSDDDDVKNSTSVINPDNYSTQNIKGVVDKIYYNIMNKLDYMKCLVDEDKKRLIKANLMARERMNIQYAYATAYNGLVAGTDHATEAIIGYYTKFGDGGADVLPLAGLTKDVIYEMAKIFNAPDNIISKAPSAGLWEGQTDEEELGIKYSEIIAYLKNEKVSDESREFIEKRYANTEHKRQLPVSPWDNWWKRRD